MFYLYRQPKGKNLYVIIANEDDGAICTNHWCVTVSECIHQLEAHQCWNYLTRDSGPSTMQQIVLKDLGNPTLVTTFTSSQDFRNNFPELFI